MSSEELRKENLKIIKEIKDTDKMIAKLNSQVTTLIICQKLRRRKQKKLVRDLHIAEGKLIIIPMKKEREKKTEKSLVKQNIKNLPKSQQAEMLKRLLAIRADRQMKNTEKNKNIDNCG